MDTRIYAFSQKILFLAKDCIGPALNIFFPRLLLLRAAQPAKRWKRNTLQDTCRADLPALFDAEQCDWLTICLLPSTAVAASQSGTLLF